ncbi:peptidylprolyl isomerase [Hydrogenophaga soli]
MKNVRSAIKVACVAVPLLISPWAWAQSSQVIIQGQGISLTAQDLKAELERLPPDVRNGLLFRKDNLMQLASNLYIRRVMAQAADKQGLMKEPDNAKQLQLLQERVASDVFLKWLDARNQPTAEQLEERAREVYRADEKRYTYGESVRVRHILLTGDDAKAKAEELLSKLKAGADFAEMAKTQSRDPGSAARGGEMDFFERGRMVKPFEDYAFSAEVGQLSDPIQTQFGYHIIRVEEKKPAGRKPYESVKEELSKEVLQKRLTDARMGEANAIMGQAKPDLDALDAFVAAQKPAN